MSGQDTLRFGIIGSGTIADFHVKAIEATPGATVIGSFSTSKGARPFAESRGIKAYATLEEMLADPAINAVTIANPSGMHGEAAIAAAKAGKHILCEKPLEITPARAKAITDACTQYGVILAPVFQSRYGAGARLIHEALQAGRFGKVLFSSAKIKWFRSQEYYDSAAWRGTWAIDGGGCLMNQSIHAIDLMIWFGGIPEEVYGYCATRTHNIEVEDNATAVVRFKGGVMGVIEASTSCEPGWPLEVSISGDRGTATLAADTITTWSFKDEHPLDAKVAALSSSTLGSGSSDPKAISIAGHQALIEDMIRAVRGEKNNLVGGLEARYPVEVICGIYEAGKTGKPVALPYFPS